MIPAEQLVQTFKANLSLVNHHLEGLNHIEALLIPAFKANSFNWILGHIINARNEALDYLGHPGVWPDGEGERYKTGSEPIETETAIELAWLAESLNQAQAALESAFESVSESFLMEAVETRFGDRPRWRHLSGLGWHETYHTGQLELLKQLAVNQRPEMAPHA